MADLAIGAPLRVVSGRSQAGAVYLLAGSPAGLGAASLELTQDTPGIRGRSPGARFGASLGAS